MTLSPPARARLRALARVADEIDWRDRREACARWARIERVVAGLPRGDETDRELAGAWERDGRALLDELLATGHGFGALDLVTLTAPEWSL